MSEACHDCGPPCGLANRYRRVHFANQSARRTKPACEQELADLVAHAKGKNFMGSGGSTVNVMAHLGVPYSFSKTLGLIDMGGSTNNSDSRPAIVTEVEHLFDALSVRPRQVRFCQTCGSKMVEVDTAFFLTKGEQSWTIPLPVCPTCQKESQHLHLVPRA